MRSTAPSNTSTLGTRPLLMLEERPQIADLYTHYGMTVIEDMVERAGKMEKLDGDLKAAQRQVAIIQGPDECIERRENMKATGIIRRIDDLGRIVIPKEIRRAMSVSEGTPMEIFVTGEGVLLKKYYAGTSLSELLSCVSEEVEELSKDLGPERTGDIRQRIRDIEMILKNAETPGAVTPRESR